MPADRLPVVGTTLAAPPGVRMERSVGAVDIDAICAGRLRTEVRFERH